MRPNYSFQPYPVTRDGNVKQTNPTTADVQADTGALTAGLYDIKIITGASVAATWLVQVRNAAVADVKVSALQVTKDTGGVIARYSTTADTYYLAAQDALNTITLYKKVAGTYTAIQTYTPTSANNATIRLECEGTVQRVFYNGAAQTPVGGDTAITAASQTGLWGFAAAAKFDDFLVEDVAIAGATHLGWMWSRGGWF